jgi:Fe-S cluster biosynthesis and repair protein YggX
MDSLKNVHTSRNNSLFAITIDNIIGHSRATADCPDRLDKPYTRTDIKDDDNSVSDEISTNEIPSVIYRFKFTQDFMDELYIFSKVHQYDERKDFKEAWETWTEENTELINEETQRLTTLGYQGNVLNKMFKSARYYFRKKSSEKKTPKQRRPYIAVNKELLDAMDSHIQENIYDSNYSPKEGFSQFCKKQEANVRETINKIYEQGIKDSKMIEDKIKKTYKNRYYILTNKTG